MTAISLALFCFRTVPLCGCKPTPTAGLRGWAAQAVTFATNCVATPGCWKRKRERNTKLRDGITRSPRFSKSFLNWKPGWKGQGGSAINCSPETRAFYETIARQGSERGYFRLHSLEVNGKMAAGAFSVVTADCFFPMKIAFREALRRGGPGHLMFNSILEECAGNGITELFFGGTKDHYKELWTQETLPHFKGFVFAPGLRGQLACQMRTKVFPMLVKLRQDMEERLKQRNKRKAEKGHAVEPPPECRTKQAPRIHEGEPYASAQFLRKMKRRFDLKERKSTMRVTFICCPFTDVLWLLCHVAEDSHRGQNRRRRAMDRLELRLRRPY